MVNIEKNFKIMYWENLGEKIRAKLHGISKNVMKAIVREWLFY